MGTTTAFVTVEEYLSTSYPDGDREYIDGQVLERNIGESRHARIQSLIFAYFFLHYPQFWSAVEARTQVAARRFRIPDVCLFTRLAAGEEPPEGPLTEPLFLAVEVLSPDDRALDVDDTINDYLTCGVKYVWVINPYKRRAFVHTVDGMKEAKDGVLRTESPNIEFPLSAIFK